MIDPNNPDYGDMPGSSLRPSCKYGISDNSIEPYVSIITPFYNTGDIFYETANSILNQSFQQFEWIIVNDCSYNSDSLKILDDFRNKDNRIRVIDHDTNRGLSAARNTGFKLASTDYVLQIDSDDLLEETALEKWLWYLESHPQYSFCKGYSVGFGAQQYLWADGFINGRSFLTHNLTDATCLIKKQVYLDAGGYDETLREGLEDWDFWLKCADSGYWGSNVREYLNWYRRRKDHSDRWSNFAPKIKDNDAIEVFKNKYPNLWKGSFPTDSTINNQLSEYITDISRFKNILKKNKNRIVIVLSSLDDVFEYNITHGLIEQLIKSNYDLSLIVHERSGNSKLSEITVVTTDVFILPNFLRFRDYHKFIIYFLFSRQVDLVLCFNSSVLFPLLPYIKTFLPSTKVFPIISDRNINFKKFNRDIADNDQYLDTVYYLNTQDTKLKTTDKLESNILRYTQLIDTNYWNSDEKIRQDIRRELDVKIDDTLILCCFGESLQDVKPAVLLGVMLKLINGIDNVKFIIAGNGLNWEWLNHNIRINNLQSMCRRVPVSDDATLNRLFKSVDILFSPYEAQNEGLLLLQAMSSQLYVVGVNNYNLMISENDIVKFIKTSNEQDEINQFVSMIECIIKNRLMGYLSAKCREIIIKECSIMHTLNAMINNIQNSIDNPPRSILLPKDNYYDEIKNLNNEVLAGTNPCHKDHICDYEHLLSRLHNKDLQLKETIKECENVQIYNKELEDGIVFWQENSQKWQENADKHYETLQMISNNIFVRILMRLGLLKNFIK